MTDNFIKSYLQTLYVVDAFMEPIQIGRHSAEADKYCIENGFEYWAFITARNPLSVSLSISENKKRNNELLSDLVKYLVLTGRGEDPQGLWVPEESLFVAGIHKEEAIDIGIKYQQRAIVIGEVNNKAKLIEILDSSGMEITPMVHNTIY